MKMICLAFAVLACACHAEGVTPASAAAEFRAGHWSGAYGSFVALANNGDRNAARIALFMHRYGSELFRTEWDASEDELQAWARLAVPRNGLDPERVAGDLPDVPARRVQKARSYPFNKAK